METPTHSVIVPVLNGARYIRECLDSILVQLGPGDELIVVDNGSADGTPALVEAYDDQRILLLHEPRRGTAAARNAAALAVLASDRYDDLLQQLEQAQRRLLEVARAASDLDAPAFRMGDGRVVSIGQRLETIARHWRGHVAALQGSGR